jgi:hypothetical protein
MQDVYLPRTAITPEVSFLFSQGRLALRGESYPENATAFYDPLIKITRHFFTEGKPEDVEVEVELNYFNSSSTKLLMSWFDVLNQHASSGNQVVVKWHYDEDDDTILEFGQELNDDYSALEFRCCAIASN